MDYIGNELELFSHAIVWKKYWAKKIDPFIKGDVIEVGSGLCSNTLLLLNDQVKTWKCLEPDHSLSDQAQKKVNDPRCTIHNQTLAQFNAKETADTVLYIDVLEHIGDDHQELLQAQQALRPNGHLVILSPAHHYLFSEFDAAIGHHRRYSKSTLARAVPENFKLKELYYLDSVGFYASLANKFLLKQQNPTQNQILLWDRLFVRLSKVIDPLTAYQFGKSVVGVWQK